MGSETIFWSGKAEKLSHSGAYVTIFRRSMAGKGAGERI
jgi:hypothetical protein